MRALLTKLADAKDRVPGTAENGCPPASDICVPRIRNNGEAPVLTIIRPESDGLIIGCQVSEPDALEVTIRGKPGPKLRFKERQPDQNGIVMKGDIIDEDAFGGVADIHDLA